MNVLIDGQTLSTPDIHRGIGRVLLNNLENLVEINRSDKFYLGVYEDYDRSVINDIKNRINIVLLGPKLQLDKRSRDDYTSKINTAILDNNIDIFWNPNPLMLNVNLINRKPPCKVVTTIHDLIPILFEDMYLQKWDKQSVYDYITRLSKLKFVSDFFVSVSGSTKKDLVEILEWNKENIKTIHHGYNRILSPNNIDSGKKVGKCILYVGGFDPRKNMDNAVFAFKRLVEKYNHTDEKFVIVCMYGEKEKQQFDKLLKENHLEGKVNLTGYIPDEELNMLYKEANAFFFPSLYEGFGLPILEAMSAGCPIIGSNSSSVPEVIGNAGLLVNPNDIDDMARQLHVVLSNNKLSEVLRQNAQTRSKEFTWEKSAKSMTSVFKKLVNNCNNIAINDENSIKIAYFSPLSPQKSGISIYSENLLEHLTQNAEIDIYIDDGYAPSNPVIKNNFNCQSYKRFLEKANHYDAVFYHMGNNTLHKYIYDTLKEHPGITVLHDYVLHPFIQHITALKGDSKSYIEEMEFAYGLEGKQLASKYLHGNYFPIDFMRYPLNERIVQTSKKVLTHSHYARDLLNKYAHIEVVPMGCTPINLDNRVIAGYKKELNLEKNSPIIGCFGFMNPNKRIDKILEAIKELAKDFPKIKLVLAGEIDENFRSNIKGFAEKNSICTNVLITDYVSDELYHKYLACVDVVLALRFPTMGETSKTVIDAMAYGKPVIVSNNGSYKELPDTCCWKVDVSNYEVDLLIAYLKELSLDEHARNQMGINAKEYVSKYHSWRNVAEIYIKIAQGL